MNNSRNDRRDQDKEAKLGDQIEVIQIRYIIWGLNKTIERKSNLFVWIASIFVNCMYLCDLQYVIVISFWSAVSSSEIFQSKIYQLLENIEKVNLKILEENKTEYDERLQVVLCKVRTENVKKK